MTPLVRCENVIKIHKQGLLEVVALQGVDLEIERGEFVVIVGRSGSGKSSLLTLLGGMDRPSAGRVVVDGLPVDQALGGELLTHFRRNVGFLWQDASRNIIPYLSALANVELPMMLAGVGRTRRRRRAEALLEVVGLRDRIRAPVNVMSGGEQQRLAMCVALSLGPKLLLADEPTGELDTNSSLNMYELLRRLCDDGGLTVVAVTHDVTLADRADRVLHLQDGRFRRGRSIASRTVVPIGPDGTITLPPELVGEAMLGESAQIELVDGGILLTPPEAPK